MTPKGKLKRNPRSRGDSDHYRQLQEKSMQSRISRNIDVEVTRNPRSVTTPPHRKREDDAGFDVTSSVWTIIHPGRTALVPTGIQVCCPSGYGYLMLGRSSMNLKGIIQLPSVIDAGYQGELCALLLNTTEETVEINIGDRVAQLVFFPQIHPNFKVVEQFSAETDRGTSGWGSSGK